MTRKKKIQQGNVIFGKDDYKFEGKDRRVYVAIDSVLGQYCDKGTFSLETVDIVIIHEVVAQIGERYIVMYFGYVPQGQIQNNS